MKSKWYFGLLWLLIFPTIAVTAVPKVTIIFSTPSEDALGAIRLLVNEFNSKQSKVTVKHKLLATGSDDCHNFYLRSFMSCSNSFDVLSGDIIWTPEFASCGWIEPLDRLFSKTEQRKFLPGAIESCTYNQKIWAVPWYTDFGVLFYRKDLVPNPPKTWAELIRLAHENQKSGQVKYGYTFQGNQYEGLVCNTLEFIFNNGGQILDGKRVVLNSPETVEGLGILMDIIKICPKDVVDFQEEDSRLAFQDGEILFLRNWPYNWNLLNQENSPVKGRIGVAPLPIGPRGTSSSGCLGGWNMMINHFSRNKEAAWQFIEFMTGLEGQKVNSIIGGRLPTRMAVYREPEVSKVNPYYSGFLDVYYRSKPRPVSPFYPAISELMQVNFYQAITGKLEAETAIENIETGMKKILSK
ncbi:MAG: ABC transporter substrate-binding protein [Firmicutes bacterium]|nr:ABC transporter substrate-binding protein [Bacillota bacterium]